MKPSAIICLLVSVTALILMTGCASREPVFEEDEALPVLAVMPLANLSESGDAQSQIMPELCAALGRRGIPAISDADMRPILRRHRIRGGGVLTRSDIDSIREATGASAILFGSVDFYAEGINPEMGMSLRVLDARSLEILFASSASVTGDDFAGLFGIGRIDSLDRLLPPLLDQVLADFDIRELGSALRSEGLPRGPSVAIIPFEGHRDYPFAGSVFTSIVGTELFSRGYRLIDAALLGDAYLRERHAPRGATTLALAEDLHGTLGARWILTGGVDYFEPSSGDPLSAPELEIHARMMNASSGRLVFKYDTELRGSPAGQVFGFEERRSLGRLARKAAGRLVDDMTHRIEEEIETQN